MSPLCVGHMELIIIASLYAKVNDGNQIVSCFDPSQFKMAISLKEKRCIYYLHSF